MNITDLTQDMHPEGEPGLRAALHAHRCEHAPFVLSRPRRVAVEVGELARGRASGAQQILRSPTFFECRTQESGRPPWVKNARRQGVIRADHYVLTGPIVSALTDAEFRALLILWSWVARYGDDGEFERDSLRYILWTSKGGRRRRITPPMLARFIGLGLIEEHEYIEEGKQVLVIGDWRSYRPVDLTSAERKRRYRHRKFGNGYYGTIGEVAEVVPAARLTREEFEEIAAIEAEGRAIIEALERDDEQVTAMVREGGRPAREAREHAARTVASDSSTRAHEVSP